MAACTELERLRLIEQRARELIEAIDKSLDSKPVPQKYGVPFGPAFELRQALDGEGQRKKGDLP